MTTAVEPRERTVEARGLRFHYVEWGDPASPPIVLLHGLSSMGRIWDPLARALQDRYRLIALDQRGHGDTSWPAEPDYTTDDYVGDLEALVDLWGLERFVLIGLSMGGSNAMAYAARNPQRITHLVPVDIRPRIVREKNPSRELDKHVAEHGHPALEDHEAALKLVRLTNQTTPDESLRHRLRYLLKQLPDGRWTNKHDPRVSYHWHPANLWDELAKITAPVLLVRGGKSYVLSEEAAERMRAGFPNAEVVAIEEAGHTVPEDTPEEFIAAVEAFLARHLA
jgi:pimeloyl-ACP methyl ester carboxylesterase